MIVFLIYYVIITIPPGVLQLALPRLLGRDCSDGHLARTPNDTADACRSAARMQTGVVLAMFYVSPFVTGVPMGWLAATINSRWLFCSGLLVHAAATLMLAESTSFALLSVSAAVFGTGTVIGLVTTSSIVAATYAEESPRSRVFGACYFSATLGFAITFLVGGWAYETFGHRMVFASVTVMFLLAIVAFVATNYTTMTSLLPTDYSYEIIPLRATTKPDSTVDSRNVSSERTYFRFLTDPFAIFALAQIILVYTGLSTAMATSPTHLQHKFGICIPTNGVILGVSTFIDAFLLVLVTIFVRTNMTRWITLLTFVLLLSAGFVTYPFLVHPFAAIGPETCIRGTRAVMMAFGPSLVLRIVDARAVGTYEQASALYVLGKQGGEILGSLTAPWLADAFGFDALYFSMSAVFAPVAVASVVYAKLS